MNLPQPPANLPPRTLLQNESSHHSAVKSSLLEGWTHHAGKSRINQGGTVYHSSRFFLPDPAISPPPSISCRPPGDSMPRATIQPHPGGRDMHAPPRRRSGHQAIRPSGRQGSIASTSTTSRAICSLAASITCASAESRRSGCIAARGRGALPRASPQDPLSRPNTTSLTTIDGRLHTRHQPPSMIYLPGRSGGGAEDTRAPKDTRVGRGHNPRVRGNGTHANRGLASARHSIPTHLHVEPVPLQRVSLDIAGEPPGLPFCPRRGTGRRGIKRAVEPAAVDSASSVLLRGVPSP